MLMRENKIGLVIAMALALVGCAPERGPTPGIEPPTPKLAPIEVAPATESSRAMLEQFYSLHLRNADSGVPGEVLLDSYRPYLSQRLIAGLERARHQRDQAIAAHPDEKPPFVEGDMFSSLFEGPTGFGIGMPLRIDEENLRVPVVFTNVMPGQQPVRWTDYAYMVHEESGWKLDDVVYGGQWEFATQGRLLDSLPQR